jgi:dolichol-phosphate mannosyltransferase
LGYQESILRNYFYATGDALIQFDADLQEPPELIADFIGLWEQGFDVVFGVRKRRDEPILKANMRKFGYRALRWLSGDSLHNDVGDFRLVDRKVVTALRSRNDLHPYLRGIVSNMGFREIGVPYERKDRILGKSKFRLRQVLGLGADGVLAFSQRPMRMFLHLALLLFFVAFGGIFWILGLYLSDSELPPGFSSTLIVIFLNLLVNVSFFAIAGDYLMKIRHALLPISRGHISDEL